MATGVAHPLPRPRTAPPLLKWVGGKRQLLPALRPYYPQAFDRYVEPFLGSGAVFFDLQANGHLDGRRVLLVDSNPDLIGCYEAVRDEPDAVAAALERLAHGHARSGRDHYYGVRDRRFNPERAKRRRADGRVAYTPGLAAMLIYLNRTGFNGLFRVNSRGAFNVPAGRYERPTILDRARIDRVSRALSAAGVELRWGSFDGVLADAGRGDFVYLDPPYAPVSATANFTGYTAAGFGREAQERLQRAVIAVVARGGSVLMSNSATSEIRALYVDDRDARHAGLRAVQVKARRAINRVATGRGAVSEFLITNLRLAPGTTALRPSRSVGA